MKNLSLHGELTPSVKMLPLLQKLLTLQFNIAIFTLLQLAAFQMCVHRHDVEWGQQTRYSIIRD